MAEILSWNVSAASNNSTPPDGWPEGQMPSTVNNCGREMMAVLARWYQDTNGSLTSAGSANAYTLAPNRTISAYARGLQFVFIANFSNTSSATLNVNSLGARNIRKGDGSIPLYPGDIVSGQIVSVIDDGTQFILQTLPGSAPQPLGICEGRLTLTSGTPVLTSDVTAATNVYFTPYKGSRIALYGSAAWTIITFSELTFSLSGLTADTNYDLFVYNNAGTVTIRSPVAWTNGTTRATALVLQDGVLVKSGATTDRYLGTVRTTGTTGQTEFSPAPAAGTASKLLLWNMYNRVPVWARTISNAGSYTYNSTTYRETNNGTAHKVHFVRGLNEDAMQARHSGIANGGIAATVAARLGVGLDSTSSVSGDIGYSENANNTKIIANYGGLFGLGYHYIAGLEAILGSGTITFDTAQGRELGAMLWA